MARKPFTLAVRAIIEDAQGRSLLLRRAKPHRFDGTWEWPGGKVDDGEDFAAALVREVREECSLDIELDAVVGAYHFEMAHAMIAMLIMEATAVGGEFTLSEEHDDFAWVAPDDLASYPMVPGLQEMADRYVRMVKAR